MSPTVRFAALTVGIVVVAGGVLSLLFAAPAERRAIWISAAVAVMVQALVFVGVQRGVRGGNVIAAWGAGAIARIVVLAVYALVIVKAVALPSAAALVSLATFFFLSTLVEPLFLER
jgi:hypothetical protein